MAIPNVRRINLLFNHVQRVQCTFYNIQCTLYIDNIQCIMYIVQCTMYIVYFTLCNAKYTIYSEHDRLETGNIYEDVYIESS